MASAWHPPRSLLPHTLRSDHPSKERHPRVHYSQDPLGLPNRWSDPSTHPCNVGHTHLCALILAPRQSQDWNEATGLQGHKVEGGTLSMADASARSAPGVSVSLNICALGLLPASS